MSRANRKEMWGIFKRQRLLFGEVKIIWQAAAR
jgi:hypothetical protein